MKEDSTLKHIEVVSPNRAGRAPYNFVPLPDKVFIPDYELPDGTKYQRALLTGWIDFKVECHTDIYIRGMWPLEKYTNAGTNTKEQTEPFLVAGKPVLPGSALRGMIRTLVETLSSAPLRQMSDERLFMRGVGASYSQEDSSFESHSKAYHARMGDIKAGYLYAIRNGWYIKPAKIIEGADKGYLSYRYKDNWRREKGYFKVKGYEVIEFKTVNETRGMPQDNGDYKWYSGFLVCSGSIPRKKNQWVVNEEDTKGKVTIPEWDVEAYKEAGCTQKLKRKDFNYVEGKVGLPCFYVEWEDNDGQKHVTFGHTPYFRIPYVNTLKDANPQLKEYEHDKDFAQVLFGIASDKNKDGKENKGWRGRVFFEDATFVGSKDVPYYKEKVRIKVLGTPKPTTYQHYLVQESEDVREIRHWDSEDAIIRGYKYYWHRPKAGYKCLSSEHKKKPGDVHTEIQPVFEGSVFKGRLRFENLHEEELGALLFALKLPVGCAHKIGMGKPIGLGSVKIKDFEVYIVDREKRYSSFLGDNGRLSTGKRRVGDEEVGKLKDAFAKLVSDGECENVKDLWETERLRELRALLQYDKLPHNWNARTRYLFFGRIPGNKPNYNEYIHISWQKYMPPQKRRVLPRPTQVLKGKVPSDSLPPFKDSCES